MNKSEILDGIQKLSPWYQRIELAEGVFTTDEPGSWYKDKAWDNVIDGVSIDDAAKYRPEPKWKHIDLHLPELRGKTILEIGCNCGFFSAKFSQAGATVYGIDASDSWLRRAQFVVQALNLENIYLKRIDFFQLVDATCFMIDDPSYQDFFAEENSNIMFRRKAFDLIFSSTVIDHVYFPMIFLYKMLYNSSEYVILDTPVIDRWQVKDVYEHTNFLHLGVPSDNSHHGFSGTEKFWRVLLKRLAVSEEWISINRYGQNNMCIVIDTRNWVPTHLGC